MFNSYHLSGSGEKPWHKADDGVALPAITYLLIFYKNIIPFPKCYQSDTIFF
jgi:hypothetical protein